MEVPGNFTEGSAESSVDWSRSAGTVPPLVIMETSGIGSMVGGEVVSGKAAVVQDADTATSSSGPRRRGFKRRRCGVVGPDSRASVEGRMSPLEVALRGFGDREKGPILEPMPGMEFDSSEEAFDFYNMYSWEVGFGIRYASSQSYRKNGEVYVNMQTMVCACAGSPGNGAIRSKMQGCPALVRLLRTDDHGWYIKEFRGEHNHPLSESCGEKKCWKSHRHIDPHTKELIKNLRANNVSMPKVYCIIGSIFGSNNVTSVTKRALHSLSVQINRERSEDDVQRTIDVFNRLHEEDEGFANVVELDCFGKIKTMMWTNGKSRSDYLAFGDAITFDTTYKTNKYNMPFGLFVGVNNHFQSVIFAGVLMRDETIESFEWVFSQFVSLMGGEEPKTILTDQCRAMEVALASKLPHVTHRWCKWHVFRTIKVELGRSYTKDFKKALNKVCNHTLSTQEFEAAWSDLLSKHGLKDNVYLSNVYANREKWAKAYFMGKFCAKQTSTQRSESANHVLKCYVPPAASMHVFVEQYHKLLCDWNEREDAKVHEDKVVPSTGGSTGWPIEAHAASYYTRTMLHMFVEHMRLGAAYDVFEIIPKQKYRLEHVDAARRDEWSRVTYLVEIVAGGSLYQCECGLWEHMGMLCCHSIRVMMHLMVRTIPTQHLAARWSRSARKGQPVYKTRRANGAPLQTSRTFRNVSLSRKAKELVELGDLNIDCYDFVYQSLCSLVDEVNSRRPEPDGLGHTAQLEALCTDEREVEAGLECQGATWNQLHSGVRAPDTHRAVGRPTNARDRPGYENRRPQYNLARRCKVCRSTSHKADRCPERDHSLDKAKQPSRCSRCKLVGHNRAACEKLAAGAGLGEFDL